MFLDPQPPYPVMLVTLTVVLVEDLLTSRLILLLCESVHSLGPDQAHVQGLTLY